LVDDSDHRHAILVLDDLEGGGFSQCLSASMVNGQNEILEIRVVFQGRDGNAKILRFLQRNMTICLLESG